MYSAFWLLSIGAAFAAIYAPSFASPSSWTQEYITLYGVLFRLFWSLALAWMVYACHIDHAGWFD